MSNDNLKMPMTWQSGLGFSKQLGARTGITADLVVRKTLRELQTIYPNLLYNPATGYNVNPSVGVPNSAWGQSQQPRVLRLRELLGSADRAHAACLEQDSGRRVVHPDVQLQRHAHHGQQPFDYLDAEYATSTSFQRSTLRGWTSYDLPWMPSLSASYSTARAIALAR